MHHAMCEMVDERLLWWEPATTLTLHRCQLCGVDAIWYDDSYFGDVCALCGTTLSDTIDEAGPSAAPHDHKPLDDSGHFATSCSDRSEAHGVAPRSWHRPSAVTLLDALHPSQSTVLHHPAEAFLCAADSQLTMTTCEEFSDVRKRRPTIAHVTLSATALFVRTGQTVAHDWEVLGYSGKDES